MGVAAAWQPSERTDILLIGNSVVSGGNAYDQPEKLTSRLQEKLGQHCAAWPVAAGGWATVNTANGTTAAANLEFAHYDPVTGIRQIASAQGVILAAEKLGKHKMVWQMITTIYFMLKIASHNETLFAFAKPMFEIRLLSPPIFGTFCIYFTGALTLVSGLSYFWKNRSLFSDA
jgi:hypothetical protein